MQDDLTLLNFFDEETVDRLNEELDGLRRAYSSAHAEKIKGLQIDADALGGRALKYEKLDQLVNELLMGIR